MVIEKSVYEGAVPIYRDFESILRDWAVWQARAGWYCPAALSSNVVVASSPLKQTLRHQYRRLLHTFTSRLLVDLTLNNLDVALIYYYKT